MADQILTQEKARDLFDYKDGWLYWKNNNKAKKIKGKKAGYLDKYGYVGVRKDGKFYMAHRLIYLWHHGFMPKQIDHINGIKSDNRIENLRPCTTSQNHFNIKKIETNTSGYKNVTWHKNVKKWQVGFCINGVYKHFGTYFDIEVANFVAEAMRYKYHGQFANNGK